MPDYKKEWIEKASIDYFAPFLNLWLACNSWYRSHYAEIASYDRDLINKIKTDYTGRNSLLTKFKILIKDVSKDGIAFRSNLEQLHYALERADLHSERTGRCSFCSAVLDYSHPTNVINLVCNPRINVGGSVNANDALNVCKLDKIYITSNYEMFFAGLFEIIYQVRNILVHGNMNPEKDCHNVVKYCYLILWDLMNSH
ncbi:MAG TPA: hypothetical protein PKW17_11675 [Smithellaceae bacterium]|nr:hypothetical protein [Smithellaceae bacterium]